MRGAAASLALLAAGLSGCSFLSHSPEIRNRYAQSTTRSLEKAPTDPDQDPDRALRFDVRISTAEVPGLNEGLIITELSGEAQAASVSALAANAKDSSALADAIARPDRPRGASRARFESRGQVDRRIVVSILPTGGMLAAGDRLQWAKLRIVPLGGARFESWTLLHTERASIDVGTIKSTRSDSLSASTGVAVGQPFVDAKMGVESVRSREETAAVVDETTVNARLDDGAAEIVQSAGWRDDLSGNAVFDATVALPELEDAHLDRLSPLWGPDQPSKPQEVRWSRQTLAVPPRAEKICARLELDFVVRHLNKGQITFSEADDEVELVRGTAIAASQTLVPPQRLERWGVTRERSLIHLRRRGEKNVVLLNLVSAADALELVDWLRVAGTAAGRLANVDLVLQDDPLGPYRLVNAADATGMTVELLIEPLPTGLAPQAQCRTDTNATGVSSKFPSGSFYGIAGSSNN